ncbi:hypothetical protein O9993_21235 [Vibrio lentus]|nr:hypothetical protein [Vibrio lentus]
MDAGFVDPKVRLTFEQRLEVIETAMMWLALHELNLQAKPDVQAKRGKIMFDGCHH